MYPGAKIVPGNGPQPSPVCLVGEAPGATEAVYGRPFMGEAGQELDRILKDAGLNRKQIYATNVFKIRPSADSNDVNLFFTVRDDPEASRLYLPRDRKYLRSIYEPMVQGLVPELVAAGARVVVAMGNTALWALLGKTKISSFVGTVHAPAPDRPFWVIPTYHPAAVLRQWSFRSIMVANLGRVEECLRKSGVGEHPPRPLAPTLTVKVNPTILEVESYARRVSKCPLLACDVETAHGQIRTVGFAHGPHDAFVIPFWEPPQGSYWLSTETEARAWAAVARILAQKHTTFIFHNGQYDIQYLWRVHGIPVLGAIEDTMLAHHALEPELPKSLGFLAATYLDDMPEWKTMRVKSEKDNEE